MADRRQQIGVPAHAVAGPLDLYDDRVMEQPIQQGCGDDGIAKHLAPLGKAAVGRQDHGAAFVARVDQLKEQVPRGSAQCDVADLVDDQQLGAAEIADALPQASLPVGLGQAMDDVGPAGRNRRCAQLGSLPPRAPRRDDFFQCRTGR